MTNTSEKYERTQEGNLLHRPLSLIKIPTIENVLVCSLLPPWICITSTKKAESNAWKCSALIRVQEVRIKMLTRTSKSLVLITSRETTETIRQNTMQAPCCALFLTEHCDYQTEQLSTRVHHYSASCMAPDFEATASEAVW